MRTPAVNVVAPCVPCFSFQCSLSSSPALPVVRSNVRCRLLLLSLLFVPMFVVAFSCSPCCSFIVACLFFRRLRFCRNVAPLVFAPTGVPCRTAVRQAKLLGATSIVPWFVPCRTAVRQAMSRGDKSLTYHCSPLRALSRSSFLRCLFVFPPKPLRCFSALAPLSPHEKNTRFPFVLRSLFTIFVLVSHKRT